MTHLITITNTLTQKTITKSITAEEKAALEIPWGIKLSSAEAAALGHQNHYPDDYSDRYGVLSLPDDFGVTHRLLDKDLLAAVQKKLRG